jgi:hypothetical protein
MKSIMSRRNPSILRRISRGFKITLRSLEKGQLKRVREFTKERRRISKDS